MFLKMIIISTMLTMFLIITIINTTPTNYVPEDDHHQHHADLVRTGAFLIITNMNTTMFLKMTIMNSEHHCPDHQVQNITTIIAIVKLDI